MNKNEVHCNHACRNTCAMLTDALAREKKLSEFYEAVARECDYPDVQASLADIMKRRKQTIELIEQKLEEMHARSEVLDGVKASFDPAGC